MFHSVNGRAGSQLKSRINGGKDVIFLINTWRIRPRLSVSATSREMVLTCAFEPATSKSVALFKSRWDLGQSSRRLITKYVWNAKFSDRAWVRVVWWWSLGRCFLYLNQQLGYNNFPTVLRWCLLPRQYTALPCFHVIYVADRLLNSWSDAAWWWFLTFICAIGTYASSLEKDRRGSIQGSI